MMNRLLNALRELLRRPSLREIAARELEEAEIQRLIAQSTREYATGLIVYRDAQIDRLKKYIAVLDKQNPIQ